LEKLDEETGTPELDSAYEEIYQMNTAAGSKSRNIASRAYKWMLAAQKQLFIEELAETVSYDQDGTPDLAITSALILKLCSNFVFADSSRVVSSLIFQPGTSSKRDKLILYPTIPVFKYTHKRQPLDFRS
jgi:hypothetical protein